MWQAKEAIMSLKKAVSGFVLLILFTAVARSRSQWYVTYTPTQICAVQGSTVKMQCTYGHPATENYKEISIIELFWFKSGHNEVDLKLNPNYAGRVQHSCEKNECTLTISGLTQRDSGYYKFRFVTDHSLKAYSGTPGVYLTVSGFYQNCKSVTYNQRRVCAVQGSTVTLSCDYNTYHHNPIAKFWLTSRHGHELRVPVSSETVNSDRQFSHTVSGYYKGTSSLIISNLSLSDSAQYRFIFETENFKWGRDIHGIYLTVTALYVEVISASRSSDAIDVVVKCNAMCALTAFYYTWYKNGEYIVREYKYTYTGSIHLDDQISCAVESDKYQSPAVHAPKIPSVSVNPSGEIEEGSNVTLNCYSEANPPAYYSWYKRNKTMMLQPPSKDPLFVFVSIKSSDSGEYHCVAENELGSKNSTEERIDVKYAPKALLVLVSPSGDVVEGFSVNLSCSSDARPPPSYTWYKDNQMVHNVNGQFYHFASVSRNDSGTYMCKSTNKFGQAHTSVQIDVQYAPNVPSVLVSPSGDVAEGVSVNLTCSSDANPEPEYTWHKENENSVKASGQMFTISKITAAHGGVYYCVAQNRRGNQKSNLQTITVSSPLKAVVSISIVFLILILLVGIAVGVMSRRRKSSKENSEARKRPDGDLQQNMAPGRDSMSPTAGAAEQDEPQYATVHFKKDQDDVLYSNIMLAKRHKPEEEDADVEYTLINFSKVPHRQSHEVSAEDSSVIYSTVNKQPQV